MPHPITSHDGQPRTARIAVLVSTGEKERFYQAAHSTRETASTLAYEILMSWLSDYERGLDEEERTP